MEAYNFKVYVDGEPNSVCIAGPTVYKAREKLLQLFPEWEAGTITITDDRFLPSVHRWEDLLTFNETEYTFMFEDDDIVRIIECETGEYFYKLMRQYRKWEGDYAALLVEAFCEFYTPFQSWN